MRVTKEALTLALNRKRFQWVDQIMKKHLPADIYGSMHSGNFNDHHRATMWLREHGWRVQDVGDGVCQVLRGETLVAQKQLSLDLRTPEEMMSVMEAVTENTNLPPPPWHV